MGAIRSFLPALLWIILDLLQCCSAQPGFISIDCGSNTDYLDPRTNISWVSDSGFIFTGSNAGGVMTGGSIQENKDQMTTLRYFDDSRSKHCYQLPVQPNGTYLIRAMFVYSNYDKKGMPPVFELAIDATFWTTIDLTSSLDVRDPSFQPTTAEILVPSSSALNISVCLIRQPSGLAPFISSLELRPITNNAYPYVRDYGSIFQTVSRRSFGRAPTTMPVRFPYDPFDRLWEPDGSSSNSSISVVKEFTHIGNDLPPSLVLQSAWTGDNNFSVSWNLPGDATFFFAILYFAEINRQNSTDTRVFSISFNGEPWGYPLNLTSSGDFDLVERFGQLEASNLANFSLVKAPGSTLPPILNAAELYTVMAKMNVGTLQDDVDVLNVLRTHFDLGDWNGDPCLPVPWDWIECSPSVPPRITAITLPGTNLSGALPQEVTQLTSLIDLWLDHNNLVSIPDDFSPLINLQTLHLQNNDLVGEVPSSLTKLSQLKELFLDNNMFNGTLPAELTNSSSLLVRASGNPDLCIPSVSNCDNIGDETWRMIVFILMLLVAVLVVIFLIYCCGNRRKPRPRNLRTSSYYGGSPYEIYNSEVSVTSTHPLPASARFSIRPEAHKYSYEEIKEATNNFKTRIGEGVIGPVFHAVLPDAQEATVVKLAPKSGQTADEFLAEVTILSKLQHKSLVCLVGYCEETQHRMLIYENMPKGSLRDHLYGDLMVTDPLHWKLRLEIALQAAKGLQFLHTQCTPRIIHGDVKSSNILLAENFKAKVAEFGIAKFRPVENTATSGYMSSEFNTGEQVTTKSDVFNFGIVLLEIICGRKTAKTEVTTKSMNLIEWVKLSLQDGNIHAIVDTSLRYNVETMWHVAELALLSTEARSVSRPTMTQVVRGLVEALEIENGSFLAMQNSINLGADSYIGNQGSKK